MGILPGRRWNGGFRTSSCFRRGRNGSSNSATEWRKWPEQARFGRDTRGCCLIWTGILSLGMTFWSPIPESQTSARRSAFTRWSWKARWRSRSAPGSRKSSGRYRTGSRVIFRTEQCTRRKKSRNPTSVSSGRWSISPRKWAALIIRRSTRKGFWTASWAQRQRASWIRPAKSCSAGWIFPRRRGSP